MFDNVAFEVVIGLVFVYLLYSLLITMIGELIATWMGIRSRVLRVAIERMLNDGYYEKVAKQKWQTSDSTFKIWYWVANKLRHITGITFKISYWITNKLKHFFLYEHKEFKNSFAGRFYNNPSIKYLTRLEADQKVLFEKTKPSYITAENFASTLINFLSDKGNGKSKLEQLRFCLQYNTLHIQPETARNLNDILNSSGNDINLFKERLMKWFDETMDRATGWYKSKIKFILFWVGFLLALSFNVDTIGIVRILANDKEARNQLVSMGVALAKDSSKYKNFLHSNTGDSVNSKTIIDSGFSYISKDISQANLVLGLGWDFTKLKKNSLLEIDSKKNSTAYKAIVRFQNYNNLRIEVENLKQKLNVNLFTLGALQQRSAVTTSQLTIDSLLLLNKKDPGYIKDSIESKNKLRAELDSIQILSAQLQHDSSVLSGIVNFINHSDKTIHSATGNKLSVIDSVQTKVKDKHPSVFVYGKRNYNVLEKIWYVASNIFSKSSRLLGFILTAFALSLGAPFWFGVLNKLVSLRGAGIKPEEIDVDKKKDTVISNHPVESMLTGGRAGATEEINNVDKADSALESFTLKLKNETGIVAIGLEPENDNASAIIVVMVEDEKIKNFLQKKYGEVEVIEDYLVTANNFSIPVKYSVQNINEIHAGMAGAEIANKSFVLGHGTLGCFLKKKGSDKNYILSCWHVMKDNALWDTAIIEKEIIDSTNHVIGIVEHGCLADTIDVGIAVCNDKIINSNEQFQIKSQHREVKAFDALAGTPVQLFGKVCKLKSAKIFHHKINVQLKYPDGNMYFINDVFSITNSMQSPTTGGDSGAIVIDMNGTPLGMIIGGNGVFSYAVKFTNMFNENRLYSEYSFII